MSEKNTRRAPDPVEQALAARCAEQRLPGATWCIRGSEGVVSEGAVGAAALLPERRPADVETIYDLASVTKAASTALLAVLAHREKALDLDAPLAETLAELRDGTWDAITPRDALLHRTGLPAWAPLYGLAEDPEEVPAAIAALGPASPRDEVVYSDLGPILVGLALERAWNRPLEELFQDRIVRPLGLMDATFRPGAGLRPRIAPTERGNAKERELASSWDLDRVLSWPEELLHGIVHDRNARFLGGAAGHAGLFATAGDLGRLGEEIIRPSGRVLRPGEEEVLLAPAAVSASGVGRCLLGRLAHGGPSPAEALGPGAAGHVGYTGTSFFLDPSAGAVHVLLTNRVHPEDRDVGIGEIRGEFHRLAAEVVGAGA